MSIQQALYYNSSEWEKWLSAQDEKKTHTLTISRNDDIPDIAAREFPSNLTLRIERSPKKRVFTDCKFGNEFKLSVFDSPYDKKSYIDFSYCTFFGNAHFDFTQFEEVSFDTVEFKKSVSFVGCRFPQRTTFGTSQFYGWTNFRSSVFEKEINFDGACFHEQVDFSSARFNGTCLLNETKFIKEPPDFTKTKFEILPRVDGMVIGSHENLSVAGNAELAARYRRLKQIAEANHDDEKKRRFFKAELQTKGYKDNRGAFYLTWLYEQFSDYGLSFAIPLIWWLNLWAFSFDLHAWLAKEKNLSEIFLISGKDALVFLTSNNKESIKFIYSKLYDQEIHSGLALFEMMHACLSLLLIFLCILAIRNRFKIS